MQCVNDAVLLTNIQKCGKKYQCGMSVFNDADFKDTLQTSVLVILCTETGRGHFLIAQVKKDIYFTKLFLDAHLIYSLNVIYLKDSLASMIKA